MVSHSILVISLHFSITIITKPAVRNSTTFHTTSQSPTWPSLSVNSIDLTCKFCNFLRNDKILIDFSAYCHDFDTFSLKMTQDRLDY